MTFTSFEFVGFFLFVIAARGLFRSFLATKLLLLCASIFFCFTSGFFTAIVVLFITYIDFSIGKRIGQTTNQGHRKKLMLLSLSISLGLLCFFKYTNFLLENIGNLLGIAGIQFSNIRLNIPVPTGISFFTFASVSYIIDVYNKRLSPCSSFKDYGLFLTFFPKLLAGPITRAVNFLPQLKQRFQLTAVDIETGLVYILVGAVKKLVIADQISNHVTLIFSQPGQFDGFTLFQGLLGSAIQVYCDFAGYSDMAIGTALLLGFKLPDNFKMPYAAVTISEFWRRWHITMSNWFRDYFFFPMEMARRKSPHPLFRTATNSILTFLVVGLWHGAGWNYIIWGGIHGIAMATHVVWKTYNPFVSFKDSKLFQLGWTFLSRILTLSVVLLSDVFFGTGSINQATSYLTRMISWTHDGTRMVSPYIIASVVAIIFAIIFIKKDGNWVREIPTKSPMIRLLVYTCLLFLLIAIGATGNVPFIYFNF